MRASSKARWASALSGTSASCFLACLILRSSFWRSAGASEFSSRQFELFPLRSNRRRARDDAPKNLTPRYRWTIFFSTLDWLVFSSSDSRATILRSVVVRTSGVKSSYAPWSESAGVSLREMQRAPVTVPWQGGVSSAGSAP
jgi:hypothetical protein